MVWLFLAPTDLPLGLEISQNLQKYCQFFLDLGLTTGSRTFYFFCFFNTDVLKPVWTTASTAVTALKLVCANSERFAWVPRVHRRSVAKASSPLLLPCAANVFCLCESEPAAAAWNTMQSVQVIRTGCIPCPTCSLFGGRKWRQSLSSVITSLRSWWFSYWY